MGVLRAKVGGSWVDIGTIGMPGADGAGGLLAQAVGTATAYTNATVTETDITVTAGSPPTLTLALSPTRWYKAVFTGRFSNASAGDLSIRFVEGGVQRKALIDGPLSAIAKTFTHVHYFQPASAALTVYKIQASLLVATGTLSAAASATSPMQFTIEDVSGPMASPAAISVVTSTTRPALGAGKVIYESDTSRILYCDGTGWIITSEPLQSYSPSNSGITHGTGGTSSGLYQRSNGFCDGLVICQLGSAGITVGTGPTWAFPFTALSTETTLPLGRGFLHDATGSPAGCDVLALTASVMEPRVPNASGSFVQVSSTFPFTWAVSDAFRMRFRYKMATPYS